MFDGCFWQCGDHATKRNGKKRAVSMIGTMNTECEICGKKYETIAELKMHLEDAHGKLQRKRRIVRRKPKKKR